MRKIKLFIIRKSKALFLKFNLHIVVEPFTRFLLNLVYLSKFSKWRNANANPPFNDFYTKKFDFAKRFNVYNFLVGRENLLNEEINYLEFGVFKGASFRWWTENNKNENSTFSGFDTFEGLPESWNIYKKGDMTTSGNIPKIDDNRHEFIVGLFQDSLPGFIKRFEFGSKRNVINLDADLYSSTLYVLGNLYPYLKKGDVIIFDEFGVPTHEFKAFLDFFNSFYLNYEVLAASNNYYQLAIKLV